MFERKVSRYASLGIGMEASTQPLASAMVLLISPYDGRLFMAL